MNLIDAVKSGKAIRRKGKDTWLSREPGGFNTIRGYMSADFFLSEAVIKIEDILANDWEVEDEKISLSWDEIEKAVVFATKRTRHGAIDCIDANRMKKELGFNE